MKPMSQRQQKVAEEVRHIIAAALLRGDVHSTLPLARLNVLDCWVSPDLRLSRLYISFPEDWNAEETLATANHQLAGPLRKVLAKQLATKYIPEVAFFPTEE